VLQHGGKRGIEALRKSQDARGNIFELRSYSEFNSGAAAEQLLDSGCSAVELPYLGRDELQCNAAAPLLHTISLSEVIAHDTVTLDIQPADEVG